MPGGVVKERGGGLGRRDDGAIWPHGPKRAGFSSIKRWKLVEVAMVECGKAM